MRLLAGVPLVFQCIANFPVRNTRSLDIQFRSMKDDWHNAYQAILIGEVERTA
jgi:hypothetical protein